MKHVSGRKMCKALEKQGWLCGRISSSHHIHWHPGHAGTIISVPVHGNQSLKTGTQHKIMKLAGLGDADL